MLLFAADYEWARWKLGVGWRFAGFHDTPACRAPPFFVSCYAPHCHLKTFFAVMITLAGSSLVAGNLARSAEFGRFYAAHIAVGVIVFVSGIVLWLRTISGD